MTRHLIIAVILAGCLALLLTLPALPGRLGRAELEFKRKARERGYPLDSAPIGVAWLATTVAMAFFSMLVFHGLELGLALLCALGFGLIAPRVVDATWQSQHERRIAEGLPTLLRQIAAILRSGGTPDHAIEHVIAVASEPMRTELVRIHGARATNFGSLAACIRMRAERLPSTSLHDLAAVIDASSRTGAPIAALLAELAAEIESRNQFRTAMRSAMKGPIMALVFITVAVWAFAFAAPLMFAQLTGAVVPLPAVAHILLLVSTVLPWVAVGWVVRRDALLE